MVYVYDGDLIAHSAPTVSGDSNFIIVPTNGHWQHWSHLLGDGLTLFYRAFCRKLGASRAASLPRNRAVKQCYQLHRVDTNKEYQKVWSALWRSDRPWIDKHSLARNR